MPAWLGGHREQSQEEQPEGGMLSRLSVGRKLGEHFRIKRGDKRRGCLNELREGISRIHHVGGPGRARGQRNHQGILTCPLSLYLHVQPPSEGVLSLKPLRAVPCGRPGCCVKRGGVRGSLCLSLFQIENWSTRTTLMERTSRKGERPLETATFCQTQPASNFKMNKYFYITLEKKRLPHCHALF